MLAILSPILVFGLVIFVHELGHFLAAKAVGVYTPRFSIGFGPALFRKRRGETEYILAALPLGGYVRMASRLDSETAFLEGGGEEAQPAEQQWEDPNAMKPFGPKDVPEDRWFESKPLWARLMIMLAGVTMNMILGFVVCVGIMFNVGKDVVHTTVVGRMPTSIPALQSLREGDTIRAVNGQSVATWNEVLRAIGSSSGAAKITTQRDSAVVPIEGAVTPRSLAAAMRGAFYVPTVLDSIVPGERAAEVGLRAGDSVVAINGNRVTEWSDLIKHVGGSPNVPITMVVARGGGATLDTIQVTPKPYPGEDPSTGKATTVGKLGVVQRSPVKREPATFGEAIVDGGKLTMTSAGMIFGVLKGLVAGSVPVSQLGGPIAITRMSVETARTGALAFFYFLASISINLAVLNLLPIPILDGGQILINILESIKGKPFSLRTREYILRVGLVAIGMLFLTVMYNDTKGWFGALFGWVKGLLG